MFKWFSKKFFGSELEYDLQGLNTLPHLVRSKTAIVIYERILNGINFLDQGISLEKIQTGYRDIRRKAVTQATGYNDPVHLVGSLPEIFFITLSKSYPDTEGLLIRRSISDALKTIIQQDAVELLGAQKAQDVNEAYSSFQHRLVEHKFI